MRHPLAGPNTVKIILAISYFLVFEVCFQLKISYFGNYYCMKHMLTDPKRNLNLSTVVF